MYVCMYVYDNVCMYVYECMYCTYNELYWHVYLYVNLQEVCVCMSECMYVCV